jgi:hypothetical protein
MFYALRERLKRKAKKGVILDKEIGAISDDWSIEENPNKPGIEYMSVGNTVTDIETGHVSVGNTVTDIETGHVSVVIETSIASSTAIIPANSSVTGMQGNTNALKSLILCVSAIYFYFVIKVITYVTTNMLSMLNSEDMFSPDDIESAREVARQQDESEFEKVDTGLSVSILLTGLFSFIVLHNHATISIIALHGIATFYEIVMRCLVELGVCGLACVGLFNCVVKIILKPHQEKDYSINASTLYDMCCNRVLPKWVCNLSKLGASISRKISRITRHIGTLVKFTCIFTRVSKRTKLH